MSRKTNTRGSDMGINAFRNAAALGCAALFLPACSHTLEIKNLSKYEIDALGEHNLDLWENLAPVFRETLNGVNYFLQVCRSLFPEAFEQSMHEESVDDAFAEMESGEPETTTAEEEVDPLEE